VVPGEEEHGAPEERGEDNDILRALKQHRWNKQEAAKALGISRTTLWRRMKELALSK
jgi:transcriptional regulator of acetoin/glycerol metabolism